MECGPSGARSELLVAATRRSRRGQSLDVAISWTLMRDPAITLTPLSAGASAAVDVLFDAFHDDPTLRWCFLADRPGYPSRLRAYLELGHQWHAQLRHPIQGAYRGSTLVGVTYAMVPHIETAREQVARFEADLATACGNDASARFAAYNAAVEHVCPLGRFHVLALVGVRSAWQGRGIGSSLVEWVGKLCDGDGTSDGVLLDTAAPRNVRFYAKRGYRSIAEVPLNGLREVIMLRPAADCVS